MEQEKRYWFVGATFDKDMTKEFVNNGIWQLGWKGDETNNTYLKNLKKYKQMKKGDVIVIKSSYVKKNISEFENKNHKSISTMAVKAKGIITENVDDGHEIKVDWEQDFTEKEWYFYTYRGTIWEVKAKNSKKAEMLIDFIEKNESQNYDWFLEQYPNETKIDKIEEENEEATVEYKLELSKLLIDTYNIVFRGAPGTGKTYLAKEIAADIISEGETLSVEELNEEQIQRLGFVQFHPSYDYTDFVEGLRPIVDNNQLGFKLENGIFKEFCNKAKEDSDTKYVFIIDEINRGEISKIFGELFFSIDPDYRGEKGSIITQYSNMNENSEKFYIPDNVYIIGTMNDIDKSVDTFDFAMRRRFSFIEITAKDSQKMLINEKVKEQMNRLNDAIVSSEINLTNDYQIGASYFLKLDQGKINVNELWDNKLYPLLKDYFRGERLAQDKLEILKNAYYGNSDEQEDYEG